MTLLSIPALVMAVIAFYVAAYHLLIYFRRPESRLDLTFALTACSIGFYDIFCVALYNAALPVEGVKIQRWQLVTLAVTSIAYMWFVVDYTSMKKKAGPWTATAIFTIFALIGLIDTSGLAWTDTPLIKNFQFPFFGWDITYYEMEFGPAMLLEAFSLMVFYLYLYLVAVRFYWEENPRRALPLVLAIGLFMAGMTEDVFVALGYYSFIYTIEYSFLGMVLVMAYALSGEIVERARIKKELRLSEEKYRAIAEDMPLMICSFDSEFRITYVNIAYCRYFGFTREELTGRDFFFLIPDSDREAVRANIMSLSAESPILSHEHRVIASGGEITWMHWTNHFLRGAGKDDFSYQSVGEDITARKEAEERLHQYEKIVSSSTDMIGLLDRQYRYIAVNSAYAEAFGLHPDDLVGRTAADILGDDFFNTRVRRHADHCLNGKVANFQNWVDFPSYGRRYMDVTYYPYQSVEAEITGYVINGRNITDRKLAEDELARNQNMLEEMIKERTESLQSLVNVMSGREVRMAELKQVIARLQEQIKKAGLNPAADDPLKSTHLPGLPEER